LISLGPEARATARSVFGPNLEQLESVEQLSDFIDVFEVLGENMGIEFDLLNENDDDDDDDDDDDSDDFDEGNDVIDSLFSGAPQRHSGRAAGTKSKTAGPSRR